MLYTSAQLDTLLEELPDAIREIISNGDIGGTVGKVREEFSLSQAQSDTLSSEIFDLLSGVSHIKDFVEKIKITCGTSEELATRIVEYLYNELFDDIAEDIGRAYLIREAYDKELETGELKQIVETRTATQTVALAKEYKTGLSQDDPIVIRAVQMIAKNYALHVDQTGLLLEEIGLVFRGEISPKDFVGHITARLAISHNLATHIAQDINEKIFEPIRQQLVDVYEKSKEQKKLGGSADENVGYLVDLDNEDHMKIIDGKLQPLPEKDDEEISFIPSKLKSMIDLEYSTKKRTALEKISSGAWEFGGSPSGGSLLAAQQIAMHENTTEGDPLAKDKMIFHGMPTRDEIEVLEKKEKVLEQKAVGEDTVTEKTASPSVPVKTVPLSSAPAKTKPGEETLAERKSPTLHESVKSYSLDPYREAVE